MVSKLISLATLLCIFSVSLVGRLTPADPLFSFISLQPVASILRLVLVVAMVAVAFNYVRFPATKRLLAPVGVGLIALGLSSIIVAPASFVLYNYLMPLDFLLIVEAGIVFSVVAFDKKIKLETPETEALEIPVRQIQPGLAKT